MSYIKTKGIVLREFNTGEADKIVTLFTRGQGKISGFARSARRPRSNLVAGTQYLCYSDIVLFKGRDMYTINSCDVIESFYEIRNDVVKLTYSAHLVDLLEDTVQENQPSVKVMKLFLNTLHMLTKTEKSPELIIRIFELRLLTILGYAPYVRGCSNCGSQDNPLMTFSFKTCGLLCSDCNRVDNAALRILPGTAKVLKHIVFATLDTLFKFDLSPEVLEDLSKISTRYIKERLERNYTKLDFLKSLDI